MSHKILNAHFCILAITLTFLIEGEQVRIFLILHKFIGILKNIPISSLGKLKNITSLPLKTYISDQIKSLIFLFSGIQCNTKVTY